MRDLEWLRMSALERERVALGYARPTDADFIKNTLTASLDPEDDQRAGPAPQITFYAQPATDGGPLNLEPLPTWLKSAERRYEPRRDLAFVPETHRGFVDGVIAANDFGNGRYRRFLAVRRTGSVEYAPYCAWTA